VSLPLPLVLALMLSLAPPGVASEDAPPKWGAWIDLEGKAGTQRHLGEADAFLPLVQDDDTLLFGNARFRFDDQDSLEGNLGLGLRRMLGDGWNLGGYGYFDRRRSENHEYYNQLTFGAELLGADFDFRANSYWPVGDRVKLVDSENTAELSGTTVIFRGGEEHALQGFDAEVGWRVPAFEAGGPLELRFYAGGYSFDAEDVPDVTGPRLRAELVAYEVPGLWDGVRVTFGAEWQHDEPRGSQGFLSGRLRIPLQPERERSRKLTAQERRMTAPIVRDVDVVTQAGDFGPPETATQTADGSTITVLSSAGTTGADLPTAVANAGADSTVILSGSFATTATTALQSGQTLMGAGSLQVRSPSGRVATLTTPSATINGDTALGTATIEMAANSTLAGMRINDTDTGGVNSIPVRVTGVSGVTIANNTLSATTTNGSAQALLVSGVGASNITVSGNTLTAQATVGGNSIGLNFTNGASGTIANNTITATGAANVRALALGNLNTTTATVSGNTLSASGGGAFNRAVDFLGTNTVNNGSTGNVLSAGVCNNGGAVTGSISFTNGTTCP